MYRYFVSYYLKDRGLSPSSFSIGNTELETNEPIRTRTELNGLLVEKLESGEHAGREADVVAISFHKFEV